MSYEGFEDYLRVSEVSDAIGRLNSDGLMYVGATWASQRALEIATEIFQGVTSPEVESWMEHNPGKDLVQYLGSDWFASAIKSGATRNQQAAADRGTIINLLWDELNSGVSMTEDDAFSFVIQMMDAEAEQARLSRMEYDTAVSMGLIDESDKKLKPKRGYQCSANDVAPYAGQLIRWYNSVRNQFIPLQRQVFLKDDVNKICGTCDDIGEWCGANAVVDLKTSTSAQPAPYHRAQLAKYWDMLGANPGMIAMNIIVTPSGVSERILDTDGLNAGLADFADATNILRRKSMKGSFKTQNQSKAVVK